MTLKRWLLAASAGLLIPCAADAAGLGRLTILSGLGQPLSAEVELASVQKGETLTARLSSVDTYQQANLPFNAALTSARVTIEKRPNGTPYIKVVTLRPVNEPFAELLIEINSENGRVTRQYTVLLDPPGYGRSAGELPPPVAAPAVRTAPTTSTQDAAAPAAAAPGAPLDAGAPGPAAAPARAPARQPASRAAPAAEAAKQYGPVKQGETLGRIARIVKPEGVSLEQTLVGLYRQNPDAFIKKNMNLVKSGRILTVPEANEMAGVPQREAVKEVRLQVADFNSFRNRLADRVANAPEDGSVTSGRIGSAVAKRDAAEPRDTVRLSRADAGAKGGAKGGAADRVRALEEEAVAREKALTDANARIAQLEKTIKDMQRLAEMKGGPQPQGADKGAAPQPAPGAKGQTTGPIAVAPIIPPPAKAPDAAPGKAPEAGKGAPVGAAPAESAKGAPADVGKGTPPEAAQGAAPAPKAAPDTAPKAKPPAPAPAGPDFIDTVMDEPLYLAAAGAVLVLVILGVVAARRRRSDSGADSGRIAPTLSGDASTPPASAGVTAAKPATSKAVADAAPAPAARAPEEPVRPAPARPAVAKSPAPTAPAPAPAVRPVPVDDNDLDFNAGTRAAAAARAESAKRVEPAVRPAPARAEPPKAAEPAVRIEPPKAAEPAAPAPAARSDAPARTETPPLVRPSTTGLGAARSLEGSLGAARTPAAPAAAPASPPAKAPPAAPSLTEFELDVPAPTIGDPRRPTPAADFNMDFNLEPLPPIDVPGEPKAAPARPADAKPLDISLPEITPAASAEAKPPAAAAPAPTTDLDFKLDDINLDFGGPTQTRQLPKDDHWYDVQQKFDLAKAYEEMGDKDGARDILQEVVKEGDAQQQSQAKKLLGALT
jgi:pilus assembly protein FimV